MSYYNKLNSQSFCAFWQLTEPALLKNAGREAFANCPQTTATKRESIIKKLLSGLLAFSSLLPTNLQYIRDDP